MKTLKQHGSSELILVGRSHTPCAMDKIKKSLNMKKIHKGLSGRGYYQHFQCWFS
jgi:hypothetical protein